METRLVNGSRSDRIRVFSELSSHHRFFDVSDRRAMAALNRAEDRHFWHRSRNEIIAGRLKRLGVKRGSRLLELGCGSGCVSAHLCSCGIDVVGVDGHRVLLERAVVRAPDAEFWLHDISRGVGGLPQERFDAVGLFDVLEHLEEPVVALDNACKMVGLHGLVVGTVPSMMCLWSRTDEQAGHRTRFDVAQLRRLLASVGGCEVVEVVPFHRVLIPLLLVRRYAVARMREVASVSETNFRVPNFVINEGMLWLLRGERAANDVVPNADGNRTVPGTSLWFVLRRVSEAALQG